MPRRMSGPVERADAPDQRIDRWLWHARFARTRTAAQRLATSGHVRINRERVGSASRTVRVGDVLTIALGAGVRVVVVAAISERRGPAAAARRLYEDRTAADRPVAATASDLSAPLRGRRPDRRERRLGNALKRGETE